MKKKPDPRQLDLFGYKETDSDRLHRLSVKHENLRKSFMVRYNLVLEELTEMQFELDELNVKLGGKKNDKLISFGVPSSDVPKTVRN